MVLPGVETPSVRGGSWVLLERRQPTFVAAFPDADWDRLDQLLEPLAWRRQTRGDVADHRIDVAMLVTNQPRPAVVAGAAEVVEFFTRSPRLDLFRRLHGGATPHLRRAQVNRMRAGDHNHFHRDTDDDPDYTLGVLVYPGDPDDHDGGELCFEGAAAPFKPPRRSMVAFPADLGHALRPVGDCRRPRLSIVLLFGEHDAPNRRFAARAPG